MCANPQNMGEILFGIDHGVVISTIVNSNSKRNGPSLYRAKDGQFFFFL